MTDLLLIVVFILGYTAIALEHPLQLNKAASALLTAVICWIIYLVSSDSAHKANEHLSNHLGDISSILFFLLGAMTIVEIIDTHHGFDIITRKINATGKSRLLLIVSAATFLFSAILDNLTTSIVMVSLCSKMLVDKEDKRWFAGMIVIAANAGGAWSPLGDVTTTMLWIGGQISAGNIMKHIFLPSVAVCIVPTIIIAYRFRGKTIERPDTPSRTAKEKTEGLLILFSGLGFLLLVPVFKTLTHLPPFMGILAALAFMWIITTLLHKKKGPEEAEKLTVAAALQKIDSSSILFFLGILLAVAALETQGVLSSFAVVLNKTFPGYYQVGGILGILSAMIDNVPLVAASQAMYDVNTYPPNHSFWEFLALTTGTGGSMIITGSAAGVAVMGLEKIDFSWYIKKICWLALAGFLSGVLVFLIQKSLTS